MKLGGLKLDNKFADTIEGAWSYAKNILISKNFSELESESGYDATNSVVFNDTNYNLYGRLCTDNYILTFANYANTFRIYAVPTNGLPTLTKQQIVQCVTINTPLWVDAVFTYNNSGELIVIWSDGANAPYMINVSQCINTPITLTIPDSILLFPVFSDTNISAISILNEGNLKTGAYYFTVTYEIDNGLNTSFGHISNPVFITGVNLNQDDKKITGLAGGYTTTNAIGINITGLDSRYKRFKLGVIYKTNTGIQAYITLPYTINANGNFVIIEDLSILTITELEDILVTNPAFNKIEGLTISHGRLRIANCTTVPIISMANIYDYIICSTTPVLKMEWYFNDIISLNDPFTSYKNPSVIFDKKGFRTDEVYAFYLGLRLKTGGLYGVYHIPGRKAGSSGERTNQTNTIDGTPINDFILESTALQTGGGNHGSLGFWENTNEVYDSSYGTKIGDVSGDTYGGGRKVRHHRFPSIDQLMNWFGSYINSTFTNIATYFLGTNSVIVNSGDHRYCCFNGLDYYPPSGWNPPVNDSPMVLSPDNANQFTANTAMTVVITGTPTMPQTDGTGSVAIGIWINRVLQYSDQRTSVNGTTTFNTINQTFTLAVGDILAIGADGWTTIWGTTPLRRQCNFSLTIQTKTASITAKALGLRCTFDATQITDAPTLNFINSYIDSIEIFYAKRSMINQLKIDQSIGTADLPTRFHGFDSMANLLNITPNLLKLEAIPATIDYSVNNVDHTVLVTNYSTRVSGATNRFTLINKTSYFPALNTSTTPNNANRENCYALTTGHALANIAYGLVSIMNWKVDLYLDFANQQIVSTGKIIPITSPGTYNLYGGDTYLSKYSFIAIDSSKNVFIYYFPCESSSNITLREEGVNTIDKIYPSTLIQHNLPTSISPVDQDTFINAMIKAGQVNSYIYDNIWTAINMINQPEINNQNTIYKNFFPNRIFSSIEQPLTTDVVFLRRFNILDYYDIPNNKGAIKQLIGTKNLLYIRCEHSLFRGMDKDSLQTGDGVDLRLKSTDIFEGTVDEIFDDNNSYIGYSGKESIILTPYGLFGIDHIKKVVYHIADKYTDISKFGIADWLINRLNGTTFNPSTCLINSTYGKGISVGYDTVNKRAFINVMSDGGYSSFILSYNFEANMWVAFHEYSVKNFCSTKYGNLHLDGTTLRPITTGNYGWFTAFKDSIVDFLFNGNGEDSVLLKSIKWVTNIEDNNGVNYWDKTLTSIMIFSKNLCTGLITVTKRVITETNNTYTQSFVPNNGFLNGTAPCDAVYPLNITGSNPVGSWILASSYALSKNTFTASGNQTFTLSGSLTKHANATNITVNFFINGVQVWTSGVSTNPIDLSTYGVIKIPNGQTFSIEVHQYIPTTNGTPSGTISIAIYNPTGVISTGNSKFINGEWDYNYIADALIDPNSAFLDNDFNVIGGNINQSKTWSLKSKFIAKVFTIRTIFTNTGTLKYRISNIKINAKKI
jgi:hypothetical protein